jgi:hypothetical protein
MFRQFIAIFRELLYTSIQELPEDGNKLPKHVGHKVECVIKRN